MKPLILSFAPPEKWRNSGQTKKLEGESWQILRKKILERGNYTCVYCGYKSEKYQIVDHIDGNPENNSDNNMQVICQMCNLIKHAGQGCEVQAVVDLYRKSKYNQNTIIKITRKMRDEGSKDLEIIRVLELREKVPFKMDLKYLRKLFGFVSSRQPLEKDMYYHWVNYHNKKLKNENKQRLAQEKQDAQKHLFWRKKLFPPILLRFL